MLRDQLKNIPANGLTPACLYSLDVSSCILSLKEKKTTKISEWTVLTTFFGGGGGERRILLKKKEKKQDPYKL